MAGQCQRACFDRLSTSGVGLREHIPFNPSLSKIPLILSLSKDAHEVIA